MMGSTRVTVNVTLAVGLLVVTSSAVAQTTTPVHPGMGGSPHVRTEWTIGGGKVSIAYGRPYLKNRTIGTQVEPIAGQVWRLGADEPTTLKTDVGLRFGDVSLTPGTYTLWVMTGQDGSWNLVINENMASWGTDYPGENSDAGRITMTVEQVSMPTEQLTLSIDATVDGGTFRIDWGPFRATTPFTIIKMS